VIGASRTLQLTRLLTQIFLKADSSVGETLSALPVVRAEREPWPKVTKITKVN
jgi:hypothetical protein